MSKKKGQKYCGRAVTWRTVAGQMRYSAEKRTALDGKVWWCIFDHKARGYLAYKKKTRRECEETISWLIKKGMLELEASDMEVTEDRGKRKYSVAVYWTVQKSYEVEAHSREEAQSLIQEKVDKGDVCVWTDGFEAGDEVMVETQGEEKENGEWEWYPPKEEV